MRSKFTYLLLALNLAVFGYLYLSERLYTSTRALAENRRQILGPEAANLAALEITARGEGAAAPTRIRLERDPRNPKAWFIKEPIVWPANDFAVGPILGALQFLENETSFPVADLERNGQTLADYGLDKPRLVVTATPLPSATGDEAAPAPPPFTLRIGDGTAVSQNLYVLSPDGARIHVVRAELAATLAPDLARLRSDQLLTIPVFEARALTLQAGAAAGRTRLRRDQSARWQFEAPITARADKTQVELAINALNALRVARFLPADRTPSVEERGLANPRLRVTLEGNSRRETLLIGAPVAPARAGAAAASADAEAPVELHASLEDGATAFTVAVAPRLLRDLERAQTALRDRRVLDLDPALVTSVTLAAPDPLQPLRIQKLDTPPGAAAVWQLSGPALATPLRADAELVNKLLARLQLLDATPPAGRPDASPFVSDAPSAAELENLGFNRPERTVTLQLAAPPAAPNTPAALPGNLVLQLAQPSPGAPDAYARVTGQPFLYSVRPEVIDALPVAPRLWRDRAIVRLPEGARIRRLVLRAAAEGAAPILDYQPDGTPPPKPVAALLDALPRLRAKEIINEVHTPTVPVDGVDKPWAYLLEATLEPEGAGPLVLTLAERSGGMTQFAGSPAQGLVFTLEQPVLDALWALLYPPRG